MSLLARLETDLLAAIKEGDATKRDRLRLLKNALQVAEKERNGLDEAGEVEIMRRELKRRQEAAVAYGEDSDQAKNELAEAELINSYLPSLMSEQQLTEIIDGYLAEKPASATEFGRAMGELKILLNGQADMGAAAQILKSKLS